MISFDTNVLIYATAPVADSKVTRARDLFARAMRTASSVLLLQTLAEFSNGAIRKAKIPVKDVLRTIDAWRAVLPVQAAEESDLLLALEAVEAHRLAFWDAMLGVCACRVGVKNMLSEDLKDGFVLRGVTFINPIRPENDRLIDGILSAS